MKKVLITTSLDPAGVEILKRFFTVLEKPGASKKEILGIIPDIDVLMIRSETRVDKEIIKAAKNLKIIGRAGVGLDNVDVEEAKKNGIEVFNTPDANSIAVTELVFAIILTLLRKTREADLAMKDGRWEKKSMTGVELHGKKMGIIGLGRIGRAVAEIAKAFGMEVIGFDPYLSDDVLKKFGVKKESEPDEILKNADIITLHIPKTEATTNLISRDKLKLMKKNAIIVNCSRGGIVDEEALYEALNAGIIAGAGIDTWQNEPHPSERLMKHKKVLALPHIGASTFEAQKRCTLDLIQNILHYYDYK